MFGKSVRSIVCVLTLFPGTALAGAIKVDQRPSPPAVSQVLPANIAGAFFANTTNVWGDLEQFNPLPFPISSPGNIPLMPMATHFQTDIQPWVGEWAAVVLLPASDSTVTTTPVPNNTPLSKLGVGLAKRASVPKHVPTIAHHNRISPRPTPPKRPKF